MNAPIPIFLAWAIGGAAAGGIFLALSPLEHSTGSAIFYLIIGLGIVAGWLHATRVRKQQQSGTS